MRSLSRSWVRLYLSMSLRKVRAISIALRSSRWMFSISIPALLYDAESRGATSHIMLAKELINKHNRRRRKTATANNA